MPQKNTLHSHYSIPSPSSFFFLVLRSRFACLQAISLLLSSSPPSLSLSASLRLAVAVVRLVCFQSMASGFFQRLANLSEILPDEEEAPSIFGTDLFSFGRSASAAPPPPQPQPVAGADGGNNGDNAAWTAGPSSPSALHSPGSPPEGDVHENGSVHDVQTLNQRVANLTNKLALKTQQYKDLMDEATAVKAEFDAYRRKTELQLRQERQLAQEDRRRLEELRCVGGGAGAVDEAYVSGLKGKVREMEIKLREAAAETQKAVKHQREAEETRRQLEKEKAEEVAELKQRYEQLLRRAQKRQEELDSQLAEERARWANRESESAVAAVVKEDIAPAAEADRGASVEGDGALPLEAQESQAQGAAPPPEPAPAAVDDTEATQTVAQLQRQANQLRSRVRELEQAAALSEERSRRQLEEALGDVLEGQRYLEEKVAELDALKSRHAELQSTLAAKEDEQATREKELLYQVRQLEDAVTRARHEKEDLAQDHERRCQEYEEALQRERERAMLTSQRVDEAESASKDVANTLEAQRSHFAALLDARDATITELNVVRRGLEQSLEDMREDVRQLTDRLEQTQREYVQQTTLVKDLELKQMHSQRLLSLREEELQSREVERQRMRALLREEEDAHAAAKQELTEALVKVSDLEGSLHETEKALASAQQEGSTRDARTVQRAALCNQLEQTLAEKEATLVSLADRVTSLQTANLQLGEELRTTVRRLEEAQQRLSRSSAFHSSALSNGNADAEDDGGGAARAFGNASSRLAVFTDADRRVTSRESHKGSPAAAVDVASRVDTDGDLKYSLPPSSRERQVFVQDARRSAYSMAWQARSQRYKLVFGVSALAVVALMILSGFMTASYGDVAGSLEESVRTCNDRLERCRLRCPDARLNDNEK